MNLKEIVNRADGIALEQDEALFILKEYIKIRKNIDVTPIIEVKLGTIYTMRELHLMMNMTTDAIIWLRQNPELY